MSVASTPIIILASNSVLLSSFWVKIELIFRARIQYLIIKTPYITPREIMLNEHITTYVSIKTFLPS